MALKIQRFVIFFDRFIESELKIVKNFPTVDELRSWASEKTSPDTIVTDLWHFVSLNHRMNGAEEGISKVFY